MPQSLQQQQIQLQKYYRQMKNKKGISTTSFYQHSNYFPQSQIQPANNSHMDMSAQFDLVYDFQVCIQIGDGRSETIYMNERSDQHEEAEKICKKYKLDNNILKLLAESLKEQAKNQRKAARYHAEERSKQFSQYNQQENQGSKLLGADKILSQSRKYYGFNKNSQEIWREQQSPKGHPKINDVSKQIVNKAGKQAILNYIARKSSDRIQQHILQKLQNQARQLSQYSFHPVINPISEEVDKTMRTIKGQNTRFDQLYDYKRLYQERMDQRRRNSVKELTFKPQINNLSKQIMSRKKSQNSLFTGNQKPILKNVHSHTKFQSEGSRKDLFNQSSQKCSKNGKSKLRKSSHQLGAHLYQQAKRRQQKAKKQQQKHYNQKNNWKIIDHSNQIIHQLRQQRIREVFINLSAPPHTQLHIHDVLHKNLDNIQKMFEPIFNQMRELKTHLTQQQFVEAGIRLLQYLSPLERAMLIRKKNSEKAQKSKNKQNFDKKMPEMNGKSRSIVKQRKYGEYSDIYLRGLMHKRELKEHRERGQQQQVRNQLQDCTFKPKINYIPENCGY